MKKKLIQPKFFFKYNHLKNLNNNRNTISRSNSSNNNMNNLTEAFYDRNISIRNGNNYTDRDYFHRFSYRMSDSWLLQRFLKQWKENYIIIL